MSRLALAVFLLLLSASVGIQGPDPEGPDAAEEPVPPQEQPAVSDDNADDSGNAVYGPRIVVSSVLGFLGAMLVVATAFFVYRKGTGRPLDSVKIASFLRRRFNGRVQQTEDVDVTPQIIAQPPPVAMEEGAL